MPRSNVDLDSLIAQLTLEELAGLLGGSDVWHTMPVERLGIPMIRVTDGPAGARGTSFTGLASVNTPCGTALAATFDPALVKRVGHLLGLETRAKGARVLLAPTINLHRTPVGGRNFECMSEDPYLTARIAVGYVQGLQAEGVAACAKHFVGNDTEFERMTINSQISESAMRELYLVPFEAVVREGGVKSIMTAYNRINGPHAADSTELITDILRNEWGFDGIVMSDWFGLHSTVEGIRSGLDLEMPGPAIHRGAKLVAAVESGALTRADLEAPARRMLRFLDDMGAWEDGQPSPETTRDEPADRVLLREAATASMTLLKNTNAALPLKGDLGRIAVIGPNADPGQIMGGGSAFVNAVHWSSPLRALRNALGETISFAKGCRTHRTLPAPARDVLGPITLDYWADGLTSYRNGVAPLFTEPGRGLKLMWMSPPSADIPLQTIGCVTRTTITPDETGDWTIGCSGVGDSRILLDGQEIINDANSPTGGSFFGMGKAEHKVTRHLEARRTYELVVEYERKGEVVLAGFTIGLLPPVTADLLLEAVDLAAHSDTSIIIVGTNDDWESEGYDRTVMDLPGAQDNLISEVAAVSKSTIVVINAGSPVTMPWLHQVDAVLYTWFPGQEFGDALADVLTGSVEPGGRLPVTIPRRLEDTPAGEHHPGRNGIAQYREGRLVGYRWYDTVGREPLFEFGHGLGYSTTSIISAHTDDSTGSVQCVVANTGSRPTRETVQVYAAVLTEERVAADQPTQKLVGFVRTPEIAPGQSVGVAIPVDSRAFERWDETVHGWVDLAGDRQLRVGTSSRTIAHTLAV